MNILNSNNIDYNNRYIEIYQIISYLIYMPKHRNQSEPTYNLEYFTYHSSFSNSNSQTQIKLLLKWLFAKNTHFDPNRGKNSHYLGFY